MTTLTLDSPMDSTEREIMQPQQQQQNKQDDAAVVAVDSVEDADGTKFLPSTPPLPKPMGLSFADLLKNSMAASNGTIDASKSKSLAGASPIMSLPGSPVEVASVGASPAASRKAALSSSPLKSSGGSRSLPSSPLSHGGGGANSRASRAGGRSQASSGGSSSELLMAATTDALAATRISPQADGSSPKPALPLQPAPPPSVNVWQVRMQKQSAEQSQQAKSDTTGGDTESGEDYSTSSMDSPVKNSGQVKWKGAASSAKTHGASGRQPATGHGLPTPAASPYSSNGRTNTPASASGDGNSANGSTHRRRSNNTGQYNISMSPSVNTRGRGSRSRGNGRNAASSRAVAPIAAAGMANNFQAAAAIGGAYGAYNAGLGSSPTYYYQPQPMQMPVMDVATVKYYILGQVEYYFSTDNLVHDVYFRGHMDSNGFVPMDLIAGFNRIKSLSPDVELVKEAIKDSMVLEVEDDKVRVRENWQMWLLPPKSPAVPAPAVPGTMESTSTADSTSHLAPQDNKNDVEEQVA